jgi:hypothetical protein
MAFYCGLTPLVVGIAIFLLWCVTGYRELENLGLLNILFGLVAFWMGLIAVGVYLWRTADDRRGGRAFFMGLLALFILILNFPVCGMILSSVDQIQEAHRARELLARPFIYVHNATGGPLTKLDIPGAWVNTTTLSEDSTLTLGVREPISENMKLTALQGDKQLQANIVLPRRGRGAWGSVVVVLLPGGQSKVINLSVGQSGSDD